jgi:hypothetical protein
VTSRTRSGGPTAHSKRGQDEKSPVFGRPFSSPRSVDSIVNMGVMRKGLFVATGGLSGAAGVKANSKKERSAKALEKQNKLMKKGDRTGGLAGGLGLQTTSEPEWTAAPLSSLADELTKFTSLHDQGVIGDEEFEAIKRSLVGQVMEQVVVEPPKSGAKHCVKCGTAVERFPDWKWRYCDTCLEVHRSKRGR